MVVLIGGDGELAGGCKLVAAAAVLASWRAGGLAAAVTQPSI